MRTLAIDFGEKRVGIALSDPEGRIAMPLDTLDRRNDQQLIQNILEVVDAESVERLVIGDPVLLDGTPGPAALRVRSFARKLQSAAGMEVRLRAETLTSVAAKERLLEAGVDLRKEARRVDAVAAQILLEEELEAQRRQPGEHDGSASDR